MNKYIKWTLIAFLVFAVLFAVGCTKSIIEEKKGYSSGSQGMTVPSAVRTVSVDYDTAIAYDESYAEPAMYAKGMPQYYDDYGKSHYGDGKDVDSTTQIIRTASMGIEVDDYFLAEQKVEAYTKKYNGFVSNSYANTYNNVKSGSVTIRVPEMHFDAVMAELTLLGDVTSKNLNGQDVTEQYIDMQARINSTKTQESRLLELYKNATKVNEMMQIETQLNSVRSNIERMEGQMRYLNNRVAMSSITVTLSEPQPVVREWGIWKSFKNALNHSLSTLRWMIELIGWLLPLAAVGVLIGLLIRLLRRNRSTGLRKR